MSRQPQFQTTSTNAKPKLFPCAICKKLTDQTCSLCRKIFYCSSQHQEIDWHMRHKIECEGKILVHPSPSQWATSNQFGSVENCSSEGFELQKKANQIRLENESKQFMDLFEQRLILRKKCMDKYLKLIESTFPLSQQPQYINLLTETNQLSSTLLTIFKPSFIPILQEMHGITTSEFILKLDQILDQSLTAKYYLMIHKHEQVRRFLFNVHDQMPQYPEKVDQRFREVYENVLKTVLKISEVHCNDKVTEGLLAKFVLLVEKFDGIWEQVFAYFNMANWYLQKTYHHKAIRCFNTSLQLLATHYKSRQQPSDSSTLTKADLLFNLSLAEHQTNNQKPAFDNMQESYRLRIKAIGKNSIEASYCLQSLARWAFAIKNWEDCLQYGKECFRVRKLNSVNYPKELESIEKLLEAIYSQLKRQKQQNQQQMNLKPTKYYQTLINPTKTSQQSIPSPQPQESFIKQLTSNMKEEMIQPKVVITPEMAETYSSVQWEKLTKLLYDTDKMMEKEEFRRVIFQSQFTEALTQIQRDTFIKANRID